MRQAFKLFCVAASSFALSALPSWSAQWVVQYQTVDYPGAAWTEVNGISSPTATLPNQPSYIVGTYADITGTHGFLFFRGQYTTIDVPNGPISRSFNTQAFGVNSQGQIVGTYQSTDGTTSSFIRTAGTFTRFNQCGAGPGVEGHWEAHGIDNVGNIVGTGRAIGIVEGFLYRGPSWPCYGLSWTLAPGVRSTELYGINNVSPLRGVGFYVDRNGHAHGAYLGVNSASVQFDVPGASDTWLRGINDASYTVGYYLLRGTSPGFVNDQQNITNINYPLARSTQVHAINNGNSRGFSIGGAYFDANGKRHGFLASLSLPLVNRFVKAEH